MRLVRRMFFIAAGLTSNFALSAEHHKSFKALVNFGALEEIEESHGLYKVKTSDKTAPIEVIRDPRNPVIEYSIRTVRSAGWIDYSSLALFRERAAETFGFVQAEIDVKTSSLCRFRRVTYGDPMYFLETDSKYTFTVALEDDRPPVILESSLVTQEASAQCPSF